MATSADDILQCWALETARREYYEENETAWKNGNYWEFLDQDERIHAVEEVKKKIIEAYGLEVA